MAVELFVDGCEPDDPHAVIWRFMEFWKFQDLITGRLYFCRADKLNDDHEGLPPTEYEHVLRLNPYDLHDIHERDHRIGSMAQFRQAFYVNCWHLFREETAGMWVKYGSDGVAVVSRYDLLKNTLSNLPDRPHLGLVRYGSKHLTGWNTIRFVTTKREQFAEEREVRAFLWRLNTTDSINRHIDGDNRVHDRPVYDPPATLTEGVHHQVDIHAFVTEVVVSPMATSARYAEVEKVVQTIGRTVRPSSLTRYARFLPTEEEISRFG